MTNLLIDTCSWINLINEKEINPFIKQLRFWYDNDHIHIIVHQLIIEEWNEHKEKQRRSFYNSWKTKLKHFNEIAVKSRSNILRPPPLDPNFIDEQIMLIDEMISNSKFQIQTSEVVKSIIPDKQLKPRKAPFHTKLDSTKDAYIYFSTMEFCTLNGIEDIILISDNHTEFGDPSNPHRSIHPELLIDFPKVRVNYFSDIGWAISELKSSLPLIPESIHQEEALPIQNAFYTISEKGLSQLEFLNALFLKMYDELSFVPTNMLRTIPPFKLGDKDYTNYRLFNLTTNNQQLFNFFEALKSANSEGIDFSNKELFEGVENYETKAEFILLKLTSNLVFNLIDARSNKQISIHHTRNTNCDCVRCTYYRFEFHKTFPLFDNVQSNDLKERLKLAYIHYQVGNYIKAKDIYEVIRDESLKQGKDIIYFIAQFNLSKLAIFIRNNYWGQNAKPKIVEELKQIDIKGLSQSLNSTNPNQFYEWVSDTKFFTEATNEINITTNEITDHYYMQLTGGWQSNYNIWNLMCQYAELDALLNTNFIIYDSFTEYKKLFERVVEGFLAAHAISNHQNSRLERFDDFWVGKFIYYGNKDIIIKFFNRYKLKGIEYSESSKDRDTFLELTKHFLENEVATREQFNLFCEKENGAFWDRYNRIFENIFTLAGILNLSKNSLDEITRLLLTFLSHEDSIVWHSISSLVFFLRRKGRMVDKTLLQDLLELTFSHPKLKERDFVETILEQIAYHGRLNISKAHFDLFLEQFSSDYKASQTRNSFQNIIFLHKVVEQEFQDIITHRIKDILDVSFEPNLFYMATLFEVLQYEERYLNQYLLQAMPHANRKTIRSVFSGVEDYHYSSIDDLLNLAFKLDLDLSSDKFNEFRSLNPYYEWLFDMDNFEYSKFDPEWILEFQTKYYYKRMSKSKPLINKLLNFFESNSHPGIEKVFVNISYHREEFLHPVQGFKEK